MANSIVYIINSAPGVGKSTLLKKLHDRLPNGFAVIDGDDVGRITPYQNNANWLNAMQDNLVDCCSNFRNYGFSRCVVAFVFPNAERLSRLTDMLAGRGFHTSHILLICSEDEIERRLTQRNTSKIINVNQAKALNRQIQSLNADIRADTTEITADEVADLVNHYIMGGRQLGDN
ncbi:MAG: ATP-binding protein [Firmicutes bacterium]|nr:ATP-binding protein [Bacillota bacterium]